MYYIDEIKRLIVYRDGDFTAVFSENDVEGFYQRYLAWLEEGNIPQLWEAIYGD